LIFHVIQSFSFSRDVNYFLHDISFLTLLCAPILTSVQATLDEKSIMKHSLQSNELIPISLRHAGLQLSRLSLTRIGCVERLLWVQMLDLSHNELRSIAGYPYYSL